MLNSNKMIVLFVVIWLRLEIDLDFNENYRSRFFFVIYASKTGKFVREIEKRNLLLSEIVWNIQKKEKKNLFSYCDHPIKNKK